MSKKSRSNWIDTSPHTDTDGWTVHYSCYSRSFGYMQFSVSPSSTRDDPGWHIRVNGLDLENKSADLAHAKRRALKTLREMCVKALLLNWTR